jgi:hypothetical protein
MELNQDLLDSPRFIKGNRRYIVRSDSKEMKVFKVFMQTMYDDFEIIFITPFLALMLPERTNRRG